MEQKLNKNADDSWESSTRGEQAWKEATDRVASRNADARKAGLFGAVGAMALLVVAYDDFRSWTGGIVLWIALMAGCVGIIFLIWRAATTY